MVWMQGGEAQEIWCIFKFSRRRRQAIFSCPQDASQRPHAVVKPLNRATSPLIVAFLGLGPLGSTLDWAVYEFTA